MTSAQYVPHNLLAFAPFLKLSSTCRITLRQGMVDSGKPSRCGTVYVTSILRGFPAVIDLTVEERVSDCITPKIRQRPIDLLHPRTGDPS